MAAGTIEHGHSRLGTRLRAVRIRLVLWIVLVEGLLVVLDAIPWWTVLVLAAGSFVFYVVAGRGHRSQTVRESGWIAAVSQLIVVLVPVLAFVLTALAVVVLVLVAIAALGLLLLDRR